MLDASNDDLGEELRRLRGDVADLEADMRVVKWMLGLVAAGMIAALARLFIA